MSGVSRLRAKLLSKDISVRVNYLVVLLVLYHGRKKGNKHNLEGVPWQILEDAFKLASPLITQKSGRDKSLGITSSRIRQ